MDKNKLRIQRITKILTNNLNLRRNESFLVVTDEYKEDLAELFYQAGLEIGAETSKVKFKSSTKSGVEPPTLVAEAMAQADVVVCITEHSISHTKARTKASKNGTRLATMPSLDFNSLDRQAFLADFEDLMTRGQTISNMLDNGKDVTITTDNHNLYFKIDGRKSKISTGFLTEPGSSGNLPSGEVFIAPIEGTANGSILIDGSIAGIGLLEESIVLEIENGLLKEATGESGEKLLQILGSGKGRNLAELGIGINEKAIITGNILEDEKSLGSCHIAFGTNKSFGGNIEAGVHIDAVIRNPEVIIDGQKLL